MKTAIIHDWLTQPGGAEKCLKSFINILQDSDIFTLLDSMNEHQKSSIIRGNRITTSFIQHLPFSGKLYRYYLPLFPSAVERFDLNEYDLVLSGSHAVAKGAITRPDQLHICYIYTPMRYIWDMNEQYLQNAGLNKGFKSIIAKGITNRMKRWDCATASRPDYYVAISECVKERVKRIYGRDADIIYPPVDTDDFTIGTSTDDYYITCSRLVSYKRVDMIAEAFSMSGRRLIIIGDGPEMQKIKSKSGRNIEILGYQDKNNIIKLTKSAKAFIFVAEEDFGIAPLEAQACGIPVIAFGRGAVLETIKGAFTDENITSEHTGIFFKEQSVESLNNAVAFFEKHCDKFDKKNIRNNALRFSRQRFDFEIKSYIENKFKEFKQQ